MYSEIDARFNFKYLGLNISAPNVFDIYDQLLAELKESIIHPAFYNWANDYNVINIIKNTPIHWLTCAIDLNTGRLFAVHYGYTFKKICLDTFVILDPKYVNRGLCTPFMTFSFSYLFSKMNYLIYELLIKAGKRNEMASKCYINAALANGIGIYYKNNIPGNCPADEACLLILYNRALSIEYIKSVYSSN